MGSPYRTRSKSNPERRRTPTLHETDEDIIGTAPRQGDSEKASKIRKKGEKVKRKGVKEGRIKKSGRTRSDRRKRLERKEEKVGESKIQDEGICNSKNQSECSQEASVIEISSEEPQEGAGEEIQTAAALECEIQSIPAASEETPSVGSMQLAVMNKILERL